MRNLLFLLILILFILFPPAGAAVPPTAVPPDTLLLIGRKLFYASVEDEASIEKALNTFRKLAKHEGAWKGKSLTYIGALYALKGKHAFWPPKKLEYVNKGLEIMDKGLAMSPTDIEAMFVHGSTTFYLPFFFHRSEQAEQTFRKILELLPTQAQHYDPELVANATEFIRKNLDLSPAERTLLESIQLVGIK